MDEEDENWEFNKNFISIGSQFALQNDNYYAHLHHKYYFIVREAFKI